MGSGKSTLGKKTAQLLGLAFYDLDQYIESHENKTIAEIFKLEGEEAFRKKETNYLNKILYNTQPSLIALGGGTICFNNTLDLVKSKGLLVYLELSPAALVNRLRTNKDSRPLLRNLNEEQLLDYVTHLLNVRKEYYEQAHLTLKGINLRPEHAANEIRRLL
jgi:shikimate kinase